MARLFIYNGPAADPSGSLSEYLASGDYAIDSADDPEEAEADYFGRDYAVVIADVSDCRDSRAQYYLVVACERYPDTPFVLITSQPEAAHHKARLWGFQGSESMDAVLRMLEFSTGHFEPALETLIRTHAIICPKPFDLQRFRKLIFLLVSRQRPSA